MSGRCAKCKDLGPMLESVAEQVSECVSVSDESANTP